MDKPEPKHGDPLLDSADLFLSDLLYDVRNGFKNVNFHYDVPIVEGMANGVAFGKSVMRPRAHGHMFYSASQLGQSYKMLSKVREKEDSIRDRGDGSN